MARYGLTRDTGHKSAVASTERGRSSTGVPIVAVALLDESRSPELQLYDGSTGRMVGWLNGHIDTIRSLAFFRDKDTTWLVSASDDQTVCIWNLSAFEKRRQARVLEGVGVYATGRTKNTRSSR